MKKTGYVKKNIIMISILLILCLTSCREKDNSLHEVLSLKEAEQIVISQENFDFYHAFDGSSSVNTRITIETDEEGKGICEIVYFSSGDEEKKLYELNDEQTVTLFELLNEAKMIKKEEIPEGAGASFDYAGIQIGGAYYSVREIDLSALGIAVEDIYDVLP